MIRDLSGSAAADNATINDANYPVSGAWFGGTCDTMWVYWTGTGGTSADTASLQLMIRDGVAGQWVLFAPVTFTKDVALEVPVRSAGLFFIRINAVTTTATAIKVRAAKAVETVPM